MINGIATLAKHPAPFLSVLSGDNMLTAISVARDCGMVRPHEKVIIADADPPNDFHPARITWRYTENPTQTINQVRLLSNEQE